MASLEGLVLTQTRASKIGPARRASLYNPYFGLGWASKQLAQKKLGLFGPARLA